MYSLINIVLFIINTAYCVAIYYTSKLNNNYLDLSMIPFLFLFGVIMLISFVIQNGYNCQWLLLTALFLQSLTFMWTNKTILHISNPELDKYMHLWILFYGVIFVCTLFYLQEPCEGKDNCTVVGWLPFHSHFYKHNSMLMLVFFAMYMITIFSNYFYLFLPYSVSSVVKRGEFIKYPSRVLYPFFLAGIVGLYTIYSLQINLYDVFISLVDISRINNMDKILSIDKPRMIGIINIYDTFSNPKLLTKFLYNMWIAMSATYGLIILLHT